jgi:hypothetical protein
VIVKTQIGDDLWVDLPSEVWMHSELIEDGRTMVTLWGNDGPEVYVTDWTPIQIHERNLQPKTPEELWELRRQLPEHLRKQENRTGVDCCALCSEPLWCHLPSMEGCPKYDDD